MAKTVTVNRSPAVNTDRFVFFPVVSDTADGVVYGEGCEIEKSTISISLTPTQNSSSMFASGQKIAGNVAKAGGQLQINVPGFNTDDENKIFGKTIDETTGVILNSKDDVIPKGMAAYSTKRADGTMNLKKVFKVQFAEGGENVETSDASGVKYQAVQVSGEYEHLIYNGIDVAELKGVNPTTTEGKALIDEWFNTALGGLPTDKFPTGN